MSILVDRSTILWQNVLKDRGSHPTSVGTTLPVSTESQLNYHLVCGGDSLSYADIPVPGPLDRKEISTRFPHCVAVLAINPSTQERAIENVHITNKSQD